MEHTSLEGFWPGWHIVGEIGNGAYGRVYRAEHREFGQITEAAVTVIEMPQGMDAFAELVRTSGREDSTHKHMRKLLRATAREISVMQSLKGAGNVVSVEDFHLEEREDGLGWVMWIRMELLESLPVYQMSHELAALAPSEVVKIGLHVCNALDACHSLGVVHRDVKPENIFRTRFGDYKLGDFGIAKRLDVNSRSTATSIGTLSYMAPEVARGANYDSRVDIYSLGIVLYRYLNGMRLPFVPAPPSSIRVEDLETACWRRLQGECLPVPSYADEHLAAIVLRACQADPDLRYGTAREFADELKLWAALRHAGRPAGRHFRVPIPCREESAALNAFGNIQSQAYSAANIDCRTERADATRAPAETIGRYPN
ncbi:MAG: serine/threonine-protein kinase [Coriobacteriales bacterium]|nr:serine/threonine-protein kinase [Coriobacteriales bacterium]